MLKEMTEKIELWLNIVHYCIYKVDYKLHLLSNKLNPFLLLGKIPALKRKFEEQGTTQEEVVNKVWSNRRYGFGVMVSGGGLAIILFFIVWTIFLLLNSLLKHPINFSWPPFAVCMAIAYAICHLLVFRKDRYIKYFKKFDKWTRQEKWKYGILSFAFIVGVVVLWLYSFRFLPR